MIKDTQTSTPEDFTQVSKALVRVQIEAVRIRNLISRSTYELNRLNRVYQNYQVPNKRITDLLKANYDAIEQGQTHLKAVEEQYKYLSELLKKESMGK